MQSLSVFLNNPRLIFIGLLKRCNKLFSDKLYLKILFWLEMKKKLDLKEPKTFQEKLQWLKLYNRRPIFTLMVDKISVKEYISNIIGEEYIIPTLGVWKRFEDIEFENLPDQFVLKTNNGGGNSGVVICKDKQCFNYDEAEKKTNTFFEV